MSIHDTAELRRERLLLLSVLLTVVGGVVLATVLLALSGPSGGVGYCQGLGQSCPSSPVTPSMQFWMLLALALPVLLAGVAGVLRSLWPQIRRHLGYSAVD